MGASVLRERTGRAFEVGGRRIDVRVRESRRARAWRLTVAPRRPLELVVPRGFREGEIDRVLESRRGWIEAKLAALRALPDLGLGRPGVVWLHGEPVQVVRVDGRHPRTELGDGRLVVAGPQPDAERAVERWYRREARRRIAAVVVAEAERLGLEPGSLAIRDQRTRWASCSSSGTLSFSWRLVVAPADVLAYVVVHELCHLREPNHSRAFWRLLDKARPGWHEEVRWLREHGPELQDYRPGSALVQPR